MCIEAADAAEAAADAAIASTVDASTQPRALDWPMSGSLALWCLARRKSWNGDWKGWPAMWVISGWYCRRSVTAWPSSDDDFTSMGVAAAGDADGRTGSGLYARLWPFRFCRRSAGRRIVVMCR